MEVYFAKSVACLGIFLLFYKLLLEKENMHVFKRFYLLVAMLAAVAIPFITFTTYVEPAPEVFQSLALTSSEGTVEASAGISDYLQTGLWITYILGVLFFSIKFCRNFLLIIQRIRKNPKVKDQNFITVLLSEKLNPHTFFSYIFLNRIKYEKQEIPKEVIIHEQAHAVQKHSLDILLVELAQIVFWFNPLLFLLKDTIKLNHEFLADDSVLKQGTNPTGYKQTLLSYSSGGPESGLVNPINYSSIKKRFTVMKTKTSKTAVWARSLLVLPLMAVLVYGFSTKEVLERENLNLQDFTNQEPNKSSEAKGNITPVQISEVINIVIFKDKNLLINNKATDLTKLYSEIKKISNAQLNRLNKKIEKAYIEIDPETPMGIITDVKEIILKAGIPEVYLASGGEDTSEGWEKNIYKRIADQEKATPEMVAEYNKLAKQYNSKPEGEALIKKKDYERMKYIYGLMTSEQKKKAGIFPVASPPPPPNKNMVAEYNKLAKQINSLPKESEAFKIEDYNKTANIYRLMSPEQKAAAEPFPKMEVIKVVEDKIEVKEVIEEEKEIIEVVEKQKVTPAMISEYNKLAGNYNEKEITEKVVLEKGFQRMLYIYGLMNESQRKQAEKLPPPPPPAPAEEAIPVPPPPPLVEDLPQPPPPPPPVTFEELIKDGAIFYYNGKIITPEKARKLVEVEKKVNVHITSTNDEKPVVRLTDKKDRK